MDRASSDESPGCGASPGVGIAGSGGGWADVPWWISRSTLTSSGIEVRPGRNSVSRKFVINALVLKAAVVS
jgi:hypothetical protein